MSRKVYESRTTVINDSGEILESRETNVTRFPKEPPFVKLYVDDICCLLDIQKSLSDTLLILLRKVDYDGYITMSGRYRKEVCAQLQIKEKTLRNRLVELCKTGVLKHTDSNEYLTNPHIFARGEWAEIYRRQQEEDFTLTIKYTKEGKKVIQSGFE
ncbi:hypothetical protein [Vibrio owensii]|uniref:hypothetical protein n=1 Tax=Vibrio harveyi group TaxID=717610 RepID=UPI003CC5872E